MGTEQWWRENRTVTQEEAQELIYGMDVWLSKMREWLGDQHHHLVSALPPQALESEERILGYLLLDVGGNEVLFAASIVRPEDFYRSANATIFAALVLVALGDTPQDFLYLTVQEKLKDLEMLHEAGGAEYLQYLTNQGCAKGQLAWYCHRVRQRAQRRRLATAAVDSLRMAHDMDMDHRAMCDSIRDAMRIALRDE
jgi:replicative DNA helicase